MRATTIGKNVSNCSYLLQYLASLSVLLLSPIACDSPAQEVDQVRRGAAVATPAFVQKNSADPQAPQTSVAVQFTSAQTAGDLNVVVVGWNDSTSSVSSVTDTKGNVYQLAIGPTARPGSLSQSI